MTSTEALQNHLSLCDELHQLTLEENKFLKLNQRVPEAPLLDRKRDLLARLDQSLSAIKAGNAEPAAPIGRVDPTRKDIVEKARAKILQILHLDRENEQLLLRYSLGVRSPRTPPPMPATTTQTASPPSMVQRLYDRHK